MKSWSENHPKAKLMADKREAILRAAHGAFLASGFEKTSMETIAAAAGVSIMTLYRHAQTKNDLFQAVVSKACEPTAGTDDAKAIEKVKQKPLTDILIFIALRFRQRLMCPETLGLLRAVIVEYQKFPELGQMAFEGLVASHVRRMTAFIATQPEAANIGEAQCAALAGTFFDRLLGADQLRALLGLSGVGGEHDQALARLAADGLVVGLRTAQVAGALQ